MKAINSSCLVTVVLLAAAFAPPVQAAPALVYETTIPSTNLAYGRRIVVDDEGNAYVIATTIGKGNDILVLKLDPAGDVLWTRPIIGNKHDHAAALALDDANDLYVAGWTDSDDFPTLNALDDTLTGFRDAFLTKFSTHDGTILYSTYLGGDYVDQAADIALNSAGEICLVGSTESSDFPTVNPIQAQLNNVPYAYSDAFITILSADGAAILYSTYLGASRDDSAVALALDANDNICIAGDTTSPDFPAVPIEPAYMGDGDIFVAQLSADGNAVNYSTLIGGEDWDRVAQIAVDQAGNPYIAGSTRSIFFPTTPGAFLEAFVGQILGCEVPFGADFNCDDIFVTKLSADGTELDYSTYLGGTTIDEGRDLAVDAGGAVHVVGYTNSLDFPQADIDAPAAILISKLGPDGNNLEFTFTIPSASANAGHGIALDAAGDIYVTGAIHAPADVYIAKITPESQAPDITVEIASAMTQVQRGSNFLFDVQLTNNEATEQTLRLWTAAQRLPDGPTRQPLKGPVTIMLQPGQTRTFTNMSQYIGAIPLAVYRYYVRIGQDYPQPFWHEDFWDFQVIP
jgi:hypothetical protein